LPAISKKQAGEATKRAGRCRKGDQTDGEETETTPKNSGKSKKGPEPIRKTAAKNMVTSPAGGTKKNQGKRKKRDLLTKNEEGQNLSRKASITRDKLRLEKKKKKGRIPKETGN